MALPTGIADIACCERALQGLLSVPRRAAAGARGASGARRPRRAGRARKPSGAGGAPPPTGSPPLPPVPPHHDQPEVSARLLSVRLSHGWVRVSIEPGGLSATAPGISRSRNPIREYVEPGVSGLCVLVTLSSWFGSTEDVRDSAQRDPRNLCPLLRMISLRRQGPGERIDLRPRWVSGIGQGRLSPERKHSALVSKPYTARFQSLGLN